MARAPSPTRKAGVRKDTAPPRSLKSQVSSLKSQVSSLTSPDPHETLSAREITEQRPVERLGGVHHRVVDAMLGKLRRQRVDVRANHRAVFRRQRLGHDRDLFAALEVLEAGRLLVAEIRLRGLEPV